jgi:hypothetical protein
MTRARCEGLALPDRPLVRWPAGSLKQGFALITPRVEHVQNPPGFKTGPDLDEADVAGRPLARPSYLLETSAPKVPRRTLERAAVRLPRKAPA